MAKKGKNKKNKHYHPYLVSGGVFAILLITFGIVWILGGRKLFLATPGVQKSFSEARSLYKTDLEKIQDASSTEARVRSLSGKAGSKDIVVTLTNQINEDVAFVAANNTQLNLAAITLSQMTVPIRATYGANRLSHGATVMTKWKNDAQNYFEISNAYSLLISHIANYKDQAAGQSFDKQNSNDGIASHTKMKEICEDVLLQSNKISDAAGTKLENVNAYFEKAKSYHEKNIAFYEADKKQDITTEKLLTVDISKLKDELSKMDPVADLSGFETSHLQSSRATLDDEEQAIEKAFSAFKNIEL